MASSASLACAFRMSYHPRAPRPVLLNTNQRLPSTSSAPFVMANEECLASIATAWTLPQRCISVLPSYLSLSPLLSTLEFCDSVEIPGSFLRTLNEPFYDLHPVSLRKSFLSVCSATSSTHSCHCLNSSTWFLTGLQRRMDCLTHSLCLFFNIPHTLRCSSVDKIVVLRMIATIPSALFICTFCHGESGITSSFHTGIPRVTRYLHLSFPSTQYFSITLVWVSYATAFH